MTTTTATATATTSQPPAIRIRGLRKTYGDRAAVDGVDLDIPAGEVFALLGPNGAGKTTTVEILEGYRGRDGGEVTVLGTDPARGGPGWRARLGIVLQSSAGERRADRGRDGRPLRRATTPTRATSDEVIVAVGLQEKRRARTRALSGGQRRRLDVALGIVGRPELLFLDEPTTGFDPQARRSFWELVAVPARRRHDHPAHHALPRRGRAARRPGRGDQSTGSCSPSTPPASWAADAAHRTPVRWEDDGIAAASR